MNDDTEAMRIAPSDLLRETQAIAVLRATHARECAPAIEVLIDSGIRVIELTLTTKGVIEQLPALLRRYGTNAEIGVGTIVSATEAQTAIAAGAQFIVTPLPSSPVVQLSRATGVPVFPGGLSPAELVDGWNSGATAVKIFPASVMGAAYIAQLRGPFPELQVIPSGGVNIDDVAAWIKAGALAVSLGGPLLGDALKGGDLTALRERARRVRNAIDAVSRT